MKKLYLIHVVNGDSYSIRNVTYSKDLAIKLSQYYTNDFETGYYQEIDITEDFDFSYIYTVDYYIDDDVYTNIDDVTFKNSKQYLDVVENEDFLRIKIESDKKLENKDIIELSKLKVKDYLNEES